MKRVFVDASAFIAYFNGHDRNHAHAFEVFSVARSDRWRLLTTNVCIYETHAGIIKRVKANRQMTALRFLDAAASLASILFVGEPEHERAEAILRKHRDKSFSFSDALSFAVMHRLGLTEAFAYDEDFRRYGRFVVIQ